MVAEPHSIWANPAFADTSWDTIDLAPTTTPPGGCLPWPNGYVGALPYRPAAITDLSVEGVGKTTAGVYWTSACHADDSPARWVLKSSTAPITAANFETATAADSGDVSATGIAQCGMARNLTRCQKYYFAVKVWSASGLSEVSNCPSATLHCSGSEVECDQWLLRRPRTVANVPARIVLPSPLSLRSGLPIRFALEAGADEVGRAFVVELFDVAGRREALVGEGVVSDGPQNLELPRAPGGIELRPGVHFLRARIGDRRIVRTLVLTP